MHLDCQSCMLLRRHQCCCHCCSQGVYTCNWYATLTHCPMVLLRESWISYTTTVVAVAIWKLWPAYFSSCKLSPVECPSTERCCVKGWPFWNQNNDPQVSSLPCKPGWSLLGRGGLLYSQWWWTCPSWMNRFWTAWLRLLDRMACPDHPLLCLRRFCIEAGFCWCNHFTRP